MSDYDIDAPLAGAAWAVQRGETQTALGLQDGVAKAPDTWRLAPIEIIELEVCTFREVTAARPDIASACCRFVA